MDASDVVEGTETESTESADIGLGDDNTLSSLFTNAAAGHSPLDAEEPEEETTEETEETEETPQPTADPRVDDLSVRQRSLEDKITELTTQNNILRYQQQQKDQPQVTEGEEPDLEKFRADVAKDPTTAIFKLYETIKKNGANASSKAMQEAETRAVQVMERQKAYESDQASTVARYGSLMRDNPEFANFAEKVYTQLVNNSPGSIEVKPGFRWAPGLMYAAGSIAYAEMHAAGKLQVKNANVTQLRQIKKTPQNPLIGDTATTQPKTMASDIPARELSIMKKTAKQMGISLERYLSISEELQKRDPSFGRA